MREAFGSYGVYIVVVTFILIISGFMAYTVSYNRAFQVKNNIISILEKNDNDLDDSLEEIKSVVDAYGYSADQEYTSAAQSEGFECDLSNGNVTVKGVCFKVNDLVENSNSVHSSDRVKHDQVNSATLDNIHEYSSKYVDVMTFASISIPMFTNLYSHVSLSRVTGSTKITRKYLQ